MSVFSYPVKSLNIRENNGINVCSVFYSWSYIVHCVLCVNPCAQSRSELGYYFLEGQVRGNGCMQ